MSTAVRDGSFWEKIEGKTDSRMARVCLHVLHFELVYIASYFYALVGIIAGFFET